MVDSELRLFLLGVWDGRPIRAGTAWSEARHGGRYGPVLNRLLSAVSSRAQLVFKLPPPSTTTDPDGLPQLPIHLNRRQQERWIATRLDGERAPHSAWNKSQRLVSVGTLVLSRPRSLFCAQAHRSLLHPLSSRKRFCHLRLGQTAFPFPLLDKRRPGATSRWELHISATVLSSTGPSVPHNLLFHHPRLRLASLFSAFSSLQLLTTLLTRPVHRLIAIDPNPHSSTACV